MRILPALLALPFATIAQPLQAAERGTTTVRTETFPRPPYSEARYYIYERGGRQVCTKLVVCNRFASCRAVYARGAYRAFADKLTGEPSSATEPVAIPPAKRFKHVCLRRFSLPEDVDDPKRKR
jgi:hypothetical protein